MPRGTILFKVNVETRSGFAAGVSTKCTHVSTFDVSTQANGQNPEVLFINGAQSVLAWISLNGARSLTKPLETRLKALMNAYFYFHIC